jgi:RNA polymerase sigma-70 factor (ECF subfamily)
VRVDKEEFSREAFVRAARGGVDELARTMEVVYQLFYKPLYRDCLRSVHDAALAAWKAAPMFRGESSVLTWLKNILRNTVIDYLRRSGREVPLEDESGEISADVLDQLNQISVEHTQTPETALQQRQLQECFDRGMKRFEAEAPSHAAVIGWIVREGLTNKEIESLLGRTPGATREFISQCRKKAAAYLAEWYRLASGEDP